MVRGIDFVNNVRHSGHARIPLRGALTVKVRFRCDASDNTDSIFLDDVVVAAATVG